MARRLDTGWRDGSLTARHNHWGYDAPAPGMSFVMVEYDRGEPLALINYIRRGEALPGGTEVISAYRAFGRTHRLTGEQLPLFTVRYDPRNWAYQMFGHNDSARAFLDIGSRPPREGGWVSLTELNFTDYLYRLRGRYAPQLGSFGVDFSDSAWIASEPSPDFAPSERWPHQAMSARRRNFEPVTQTRAVWRNPCLDIDFAVVDQDDRLSLVVDYKSPGAKINPATANLKALSGLYVRDGHGLSEVPAMLVSYQPDPDGWTFRVHCLNKYARLHLAFVLGAEMDSDLSALAHTIAGTEWVDLTESQWRSVLDCARDL